MEDEESSQDIFTDEETDEEMGTYVRITTLAERSAYTLARILSDENMKAIKETIPTICFDLIIECKKKMDNTHQEILETEIMYSEYNERYIFFLHIPQPIK